MNKPLKYTLIIVAIIVAVRIAGSPSTHTESSSTYDPYPPGRDTSMDVVKTIPKKEPKVDLQADFDKEINELMRKPNAAYYATMCGNERKHAEQMAALNHKSEEEQQMIGFKTAFNCMDAVLGHKVHFPGL